jgi:hypothetical protein
MVSKRMAQLSIMVVVWVVSVGGERGQTFTMPDALVPSDRPRRDEIEERPACVRLDSLSQSVVTRIHERAEARGTWRGDVRQ